MQFPAATAVTTNPEIVHFVRSVGVKVTVKPEVAETVTLIVSPTTIEPIDGNVIDWLAFVTAKEIEVESAEL